MAHSLPKQCRTAHRGPPLPTGSRPKASAWYMIQFTFWPLQSPLSHLLPTHPLFPILAVATPKFFPLPLAPRHLSLLSPFLGAASHHHLHYQCPPARSLTASLVLTLQYHVTSSGVFLDMPPPSLAVFNICKWHRCFVSLTSLPLL